MDTRDGELAHLLTPNISHLSLQTTPLLTRLTRDQMARPVRYAFPILSSQGSISHRLLHTIFRSGGLIISMFIGWLVSNERYAFFE